MKTSSLLLTLLLSFNGYASQEDIDKIEAAAMTLDTPALQRLSKSSEGYAAALAHYRLSVAYAYVDQGNEDKALTALDAAIEQTETLTQDRPEESES